MKILALIAFNQFFCSSHFNDAPEAHNDNEVAQPLHFHHVVRRQKYRGAARGKDWITVTIRNETFSDLCAREELLDRVWGPWRFRKTAERLRPFERHRLLGCEIVPGTFDGARGLVGAIELTAPMPSVETFLEGVASAGTSARQVSVTVTRIAEGTTTSTL